MERVTNRPKPESTNLGDTELLADRSVTFCMLLTRMQ
jgi:hypothetical protein